MLILNSEQILALVSMPKLIERLREAFRGNACVPPRQVIDVPGGKGRLFLSMPAFDATGAGAVKLATVFPDNPKQGQPSIQAAIVVFSETGTPSAVLDGGIVTKLRTGAASALASTYLSRPDSARLLVIGTGALAPYMAMAHCAVRPITIVEVSGRSPERAEATAAQIRTLVASTIEVRAAASAADAAAAADIVSCSTNSATPVLSGKWLKPGTFVDLVGSFSPTRRETDDEVVLRSRIFVDTLEGAMSEAGDILDPLSRGVIERQRVEGELSDLVSGRIAGRRAAEEIILFKSVGTALEDLAAAQLIAATCEQNSHRVV